MRLLPHPSVRRALASVPDAADRLTAGQSAALRRPLARVPRHPELRLVALVALQEAARHAGI